jgi:hypothetical protein
MGFVFAGMVGIVFGLAKDFTTMLGQVQIQMSLTKTSKLFSSGHHFQFETGRWSEKSH